MKRTIQTVFMTISVFVIVILTFTHMTTREMKTHKSSLPLHFTKVKPLHCPTPSLSKENLPITALASFPGCGNTWVRHLIQSMTGILTGSIYNDKRLLKHGFPGEGKEDGSVIAIKTHNYKTNPRYQKNVVVMRNPYSALMAEFNRLRSRSHTATVKIDMFIKDWNSFFNRTIMRYRYFYMSWEPTQNLHLVMFDNLVNDMGSELTGLLKYLQNSTSIVGNVQCALGNSTGSHKRDHSKSAPVEFFYSKEKIIRMNKVIDDLYKNYTKRFKKQANVIKLWKLPEE